MICLLKGWAAVWHQQVAGEKIVFNPQNPQKKVKELSFFTGRGDILFVGAEFFWGGLRGTSFFIRSKGKTRFFRGAKGVDRGQILKGAVVVTLCQNEAEVKFPMRKE